MAGWISARLKAAAATLLLASMAEAQVVLNEIFYHAPADLDELEWIELHNPTDNAVDLAGWSLSKGVKFTFRQGARLAPRGYLVVCRNAQRFAEHYPCEVGGEFEKGLKNSGDEVILRNAAGAVVDAVAFGTRWPWPESPDGGTASLERICPTAPGTGPENWASSNLGIHADQPAGTPGQPNSVYSATLPPVISDVTFSPAIIAPGRPLDVKATIRSDAPLRELVVLCQTVEPGNLGDEMVVKMTHRAGQEYVASFLAPTNGHIVRLRIRATDQRSAQRLYPGANEPRPALSCLMEPSLELGKIPGAHIIHADATQAARAKSGLRTRRFGFGGPPDETMMARFQIEQQLRTELDVASLWAKLMLTNEVADDFTKLRPLFAAAETNRAQIEATWLGAPTPVRPTAEFPTVLQSAKADLRAKLEKVLNADQLRTFEAWQAPAEAGDRRPGFGPNPAMMVRMFIPLESAFLGASLLEDLTPAQFLSLRDAYREAIQQRDLLAPQMTRFMGPPMGPDDDRDTTAAKLEAIEPTLQRRVQSTLTPGQQRALASRRPMNRPGFMGFGEGPEVPAPARGTDACIYVDPATQTRRLFDFAHIPERSGGWKVHFGRGDHLGGMTTINLIFEANERWVLAESVAYEFYRRAGQAAPLTDFVRLWVDDQPFGYHLLVEQPNKAFLRRNRLNTDGNLYKANWRGRGLVGQHEKRASATPGHDDLVQLVEQLEQTKNDASAQWELIKRRCDAGQIINHYAVRMLACDWDGFFNNYYLYHDLKGSGKWMLFPWDQDQVWGDPGGFSNGRLFVDMALSYGAEGDRPPGGGGGGWPGGRERGQRGARDDGPGGPDQGPGGRVGGPERRDEGPPGPPMMMGGASWRAGGYISRPLLANPTFKKLTLARMKELVESEFNETRLDPMIDALGARLQEEVTYRATLLRENPASARRLFEENLASLKEFVRLRRQWLLNQDALKNAEAYDRTQLR